MSPDTITRVSDFVEQELKPVETELRAGGTSMTTIQLWILIGLVAKVSDQPLFFWAALAALVVALLHELVDLLPFAVRRT